jgi:hypothetical protein
MPTLSIGTRDDIARMTAIDWFRIARSEYLEMPGLRLTAAQARRLWGLDDRTCTTILNALVNDNFLRLTPDGSYILAASHDVPAVAGGVRRSGAPGSARG